MNDNEGFIKNPMCEKTKKSIIPKSEYNKSSVLIILKNKLLHQWYY